MIIEQLSYKPGLEDPAEIIMARVRDELPKFRAIFGSRVLIALAPSSSTLGKLGLIQATDKTKDEGRFQGKAGLVLKLGVNAFKYDSRFPTLDWEGPKAEVGDWVHFFNSDSREIGIGGICCRYIWDSDVLGVVSEPECVW